MNQDARIEAAAKAIQGSFHTSYWEIAKAALAAADRVPGEDDEYLVDALRDELDSALRKLTTVLVDGKSPDEAAWWLCANHARFIIDHPNLDAEQTLIEMATRAGTPPKGENWRDWFDRVRTMKPVARVSPIALNPENRDRDQ